jgi:DNA-directed RNA polymerase subunit beta
MELYLPASALKKGGDWPQPRRYLEKSIVLFYLPLMLSDASFFVGGIYRSILHQLVRGPGVYFSKGRVAGFSTRASPSFFSCRTPCRATLVPQRGGWMVLSIDTAGFITAKLSDKSKPVSILVLLRALGFSDEEILGCLTTPECLKETFRMTRVLYGPSLSREKAFRLLSGGNGLDEGLHSLYARFYDLQGPSFFDLGLQGRVNLNRRMGMDIEPNVRNLTPQDMIMAVDHLVQLYMSPLTGDIADHLGFRRVKTSGEVILFATRIAFRRASREAEQTLSSEKRLVRAIESEYQRSIDKAIKRDSESGISMNEILTSKGIKRLENLGEKALLEKIYPTSILKSSVREFFSMSPMSLFLNQRNVLADISQKCRVTVFGPGGLGERSHIATRGVAPGFRGRLCPFDTPDGQRVGGVLSFAMAARVGPLGFIESPYYMVRSGRVLVDMMPVYLDALQEERFVVARREDIWIDETGALFPSFIWATCLGKCELFSSEEIEFVEVSTFQSFSISVSQVPFMTHCDGVRVMMGGKMQRQALIPDNLLAPLFRTGNESLVTTLPKSECTGRVVNVSSSSIVVKSKEGPLISHPLERNQRSNQGGFLGHRPLVTEGQKVFSGQLLADCVGTVNGDFVPGRDLIMAYMMWDGFNFEDAFVVSERLVYDRVLDYSSVRTFTRQVGFTSLGPENVTREIPDMESPQLRHLGHNGIARVGAWVEGGDILVGVTAPKVKDEELPHVAILRAMKKIRRSPKVKDVSLRLPAGCAGRVVRVKSLPPHLLLGDTKEAYRVYVGGSSPLMVGDKLAGRYGNKGVVSVIVAREDMPYMPDGTPVEILLNPLGVPSRMNIGQLLEAISAWVALGVDMIFTEPLFEKWSDKDLEVEIGKMCSLGIRKAMTKRKWVGVKTWVRDGYSGRAYESPVFVGIVHVLHLEQSMMGKVNARGTGPYATITEQPVQGKARGGGQRLGEMEVWALQSVGAVYNLRELLTVKSDDVSGRESTFSGIVFGKALPDPGIPDGFKVLVRELQALCINIEAYSIGSEGPYQLDILA